MSSDTMLWCFTHGAPWETWLEEDRFGEQEYCSMATLWEYAGVDHGPPCRTAEVPAIVEHPQTP